MLRTTPRVLLFVLIAAAIVCLPRVLERWNRHEMRAPSIRPAALRAAQEPDHLSATAATLPADLELAIVVENLAGLRTTPEGRAVASLLQEAGVMQPLDASWKMLSERLGLSPAEGVDRLLGRRVVLAVRGGGTGGVATRAAAETAGRGARRWTLLSEIDDATAELLRANLDVAPRTVVKGQQVYAVEGGNLDLALHRRADGEGGGVTLLLGPSDAPDLLNDLILAVAHPLPERKTMARSPVLDEARRLGAADVVVLARVDPPAEKDRPDAPHWDNFLVLNLRREPAKAAQALGGVSARIILRDASAWGRLVGLGAWSDAPVHAAGRETLAAIIEATSPETPAPETAGPIRALLANLAPPPEISERVTGRRALFVFAGAGKPLDGKPAGVRVAVAAELNGLAATAPAIDALIAARIGDAERLLGSDAPAPTMSAGVPLRAVRLEPLRVPEDNPLEQLVGGTPVIAWTFRPARTSAREGEAGAERETQEDPGWCVLSLTAGGEEPEAAALHAADLLTSTAPGDVQRRWLSVGRMSPAALMDRLRGVPMLERFARLAGHVQGVEWRLELTDLLDVEGEAQLELAQPE